MAWNQQEIETALEKRLKKKFSGSLSEATKFFGYYTYARDILLSEGIFDSIKSLKRDLSDHGQDHIMNVLYNAGKLLGKELEKLDAIQVYFICTIILFHDVGNLIAERETHHQQDTIREVYDYIRDKKREFDEERMLVPEVASKHSGIAGDGSKDTINELSITPPYMFNTEIYSRRCAALLRFADELAEGPHRTSLYMNKYYNYPYKNNSAIYHKYGEITKVNIDRKGERICLTYNFSIPAKDGSITEESHKDFIELYSFVIKRMLKVEAERKYCKYYCDWLAPFKKTHVTFNYIIEDEVQGRLKSKRINLDKSVLLLDDLVLPSDVKPEMFFTNKKEYEPETVFSLIKVALNEKE